MHVYLQIEYLIQQYRADKQNASSFDTACFFSVSDIGGNSVAVQKSVYLVMSGVICSWWSKAEDKISRGAGEIGTTEIQPLAMGSAEKENVPPIMCERGLLNQYHTWYEEAVGKHLHLSLM